MSNKIEALDVKRDEKGYWTHPEYAKFAGDREMIPIKEVDEWLKNNGLLWRYELIGEDTDVLDWGPCTENDDGWFVGSIHETEYGPVCIWLKRVEASNE